MSNRKLKEYLNNIVIITVAHAHEGRGIPYMTSLVKVTHKTNEKITDVGSGMARGITVTVLLQHTKRLRYMQIT